MSSPEFLEEFDALGNPAPQTRPGESEAVFVRRSGVHQIFLAVGGTGAVARLLEVGHSTASEMRRRGSIPVRYWPRLVAVAAEREIEGITNDSLVDVHTSAA